MKMERNDYSLRIAVYPTHIKIPFVFGEQNGCDLLCYETRIAVESFLFVRRYGVSLFYVRLMQRCIQGLQKLVSVFRETCNRSG